MTYNMLLKMIEKGQYVKEDILNKIDTFYANNRITQEQYIELLAKVESQKTPQNWFIDNWGENSGGTIYIKNGEISSDKTKTIRSINAHTVGTSSPYQGIL